MEDHYLSQPLLPTTITASVSSSIKSSPTLVHHRKSEPFLSNSCVLLRLITIIVIGVVSVWANYEASKGFSIKIVNHANKESPAAKRFNLFYVTNDKATRIILNTSSFVENLLYPDANHSKKQVDHVTLRLASYNLTGMNVAKTDTNRFDINISPSTVRDVKSLDASFVPMVLRGMARVWLWDGESTVPSWLLDGMVEYINGLAGFGPMGSVEASKSAESYGFCLGNKDPLAVAKFLGYCEKHRKGFIPWLNQALKNEWLTVESALGMELQNLCDLSKNLSSHDMIYL
ncbi:hypothetical protein K2173_023234 [Erythroxylum novogranatense]|uniref:Uncharacterized protein n=1 Tax=Erythroxylum novogranatense TaxID=1862640 RepID=A0AAV8T9M9_9ROSI|nr:hypothetical protein K2173_023234 [Erythroxylum novogranatense]